MTKVKKIQKILDQEKEQIRSKQAKLLKTSSLATKIIISLIIIFCIGVVLYLEYTGFNTSKDRVDESLSNIDNNLEIIKSENENLSINTTTSELIDSLKIIQSKSSDIDYDLNRIRDEYYRYDESDIHLDSLRRNNADLIRNYLWAIDYTNQFNDTLGADYISDINTTQDKLISDYKEIENEDLNTWKRLTSEYKLIFPVFVVGSRQL